MLRLSEALASGTPSAPSPGPASAAGGAVQPRRMTTAVMLSRLPARNAACTRSLAARTGSRPWPAMERQRQSAASWSLSTSKTPSLASTSAQSSGTSSTTLTSGVAVTTGSGALSSASPKPREVERNHRICAASFLRFCSSFTSLLSARGPTRQTPRASCTTVPPARWIRRCSSGLCGRWSSETRRPWRPRSSTARQSPHQATKSLATPPRARGTVPGWRSGCAGSLGLGQSAAQPRVADAAARGASKPWQTRPTMPVEPSSSSFLRAATRKERSTASKASTRAPEMSAVSFSAETFTRLPSRFARAW
mmetsp:Transcript_57898/g.185957  ORF Transcript_57898/g.185957 Transcript_57898/m.185957 type:complete len:308 (+) Transcript_57898:214-1137(+)